MNLAEAIKPILSKAGVSEETISTITANKALSEIAISDDDAPKLSGLINKAEAKADPEIRDYFFRKREKEILDTVDKISESFAEKLGLNDEEKAAYSDKKTYQRLEYLRDLHAVKMDEKLNAVGKDKKTLQEEAQKQIDQIRAEMQKVQGQLEQERTNYTAKLSDFQYNNLLATVKYDTTKLPEPVLRTSHKQLVDEYLKTKGAKLVFDNERFVLKNATSPDLDYLENGQPVNFADVVQKVAAENKLIAVSNPQPGGGNPNPVPPQPAQRHQYTPNNYIGNEVVSNILADLKSGSK